MKKWIPLVLVLTAPAGAAAADTDASAERTVQDERGGASPRRAEDASAKRTVQDKRGGASPRRAEDYWPQWRGPLPPARRPKARPPVEWSESKNVRGRSRSPARARPRPVVWGDLIFVPTAMPPTNVRRRAAPRLTPRPRGDRAPVAVRAALRPRPSTSSRSSPWDGATERCGGSAWCARSCPHEGTHPTGTFASSSAVTDGERVYAFFGSRGLYALDMAGKVVWEKDLGDMNIKLGFGEGASPALHDDRLVVNWDHEGESFIVALDARPGRSCGARRARSGRRGPRRSWSNTRA